MGDRIVTEEWDDPNASGARKTRTRNLDRELRDAMPDKVSDAEDVGAARARADAKSIAQGEKDFGPNNSSVRNALGTRNTEERQVGPFIRIYNKGGLVRGLAKGGPTTGRKNWYKKNAYE